MENAWLGGGREVGWSQRWAFYIMDIWEKTLPGRDNKCKGPEAADGMFWEQ